MEQPKGVTTLAAQIPVMRQLVRTDCDLRVRQRAQALLLVAEGQSVAAVARWPQPHPSMAHPLSRRRT